MNMIKRRPSQRVLVGKVMLGGGAPVVVQSMTNTDTADADATIKQVFELAKALASASEAAKSLAAATVVVVEALPSSGESVQPPAAG